MDDDVAMMSAQKSRKEKQERKSEVLKELETSKHRFLSAIRNDEKDANVFSKFEVYEMQIEKTIKINSEFNLLHYLRKSLEICLTFGKRTDKNSSWKPWSEYSFNYILTHARLFGDQKQNMLQLKSGNPSTTPKHAALIRIPHELLPNLKYMQQITNLIEALKIGYDEKKYFILNANMTYLALLIIRCQVLEEVPFCSSWLQNINDNYQELCPHAFRNCELPRIGPLHLRLLDLRCPSSLAVYAFMTIKSDDLTKTILQNTCLQYMKWYKMELPDLFFKVISLYGVEEARLWDLLSCMKTRRSLFDMAEVFNCNATAMLFPYGEVMSPAQFRKLSGAQNKYLCTILACIVDFKIGLDKSFFRKSDWADSDTINVGMKIARAFHQFHKV